MSGFLATHPPLTERIRRLDPHWDGELPHVDEAAAAGRAEVSALGATPLAAPAAPTGQRMSARRLDPRQIVERIGDPSEQHLAYSARLLAALPQSLKRRLREPLAARAVVFGLLLDSSPEVRERQLQYLQTSI